MRLFRTPLIKQESQSYVQRRIVVYNFEPKFGKYLLTSAVNMKVIKLYILFRCIRFRPPS